MTRTVSRVSATVTAAAAAVALSPIAASAAPRPGPADLDPTFGARGVSTFDAGRLESARATVVQPDGRIVVAGTVTDATAPIGPPRAVVYRLLSNGARDRS